MRNENFNFFFQNLNIQTRSEITESELKISEPDPTFKNTRTGSTPLYRNTRKSGMPYPNPNGYPKALQSERQWFYYASIHAFLTDFLPFASFNECLVLSDEEEDKWMREYVPTTPYEPVFPINFCFFTGIV